jgi:Ca-activated chloride channel family protein
MYLLNPLYLLTIPAIIALAIYARRYKGAAGIKFSSGELLSGIKPSVKAAISRYLPFVRTAALILIAIALCRPQAPLGRAHVETEGIDIVFAVDSSTSMLGEDFQVRGRRLSRIDIVKDVIKDFIKGRSNDRLGLVTFAARAYTMCPLTLDYGWLLTNVDRLQAGIVEDGTAIGSGITASLNRLRASSAKSKVVILLTDGRNNAGNVAPLVAAQAANALKVKIYAIGAGTRGLVPYPVRDMFGRKVYQQVQIDLDEETLQQIASVSGGKYFRATDTESLRRIYAEIDRMERSKIEEKGYQQVRELFAWFLIPGLLLLGAEIVLSNTWLRRLP